MRGEKVQGGREWIGRKGRAMRQANVCDSREGSIWTANRRCSAKPDDPIPFLDVVSLLAQPHSVRLVPT